MARPKAVGGGRPTVVALRVSAAEEAWIDEVRGSLSRSEFLRWLLVQERRRRSEA